MTKITNWLNQKKVALILLGVIGVGGGYLLWDVTKVWGIGIGHDAFYYVTSAKNFLSGLGLGTLASDGSINPLAKYPPFYPVMLIVIGWISGLELETAALWINICLYGVSIFLIGWLIYSYSRSTIVGALGSLIALSSPFWLDNFRKAMSEPPYIVLVLLMLYALSEFGKTKSRKYLILASLFAGLGFLTRYIGGSMIAFGGLCLLLFSYENHSERIKTAVGFGLLVMVVISPWIIINIARTGAATDRSLIFHPPAWEKFAEELPNIYNWLLPIITSYIYEAYVFFIFLAGLMVVLVVWSWKLKQEKSENSEGKDAFRLVVMILGYMASYLILLLVSMSFFDASTPFNDRILSPVYALFVIFGVLLTWKGAGFFRYKFVSITAFILGLVIIFFNIQLGTVIIPLARTNGAGFTGEEWQNSETIAVLSQLGPNTLIYTNEPIPVAYLTGIVPMGVPEKINQLKETENTEYFNSIEEMQEQLKEEKGILVIFFTIRLHKDSHTVKELSEGLVLWKTLEDGKIFVHPDAIPDFVEE